MKRHEFIKLAIRDPLKASEIMKCQADNLKKSRNVSQTADVLSKSLFISDRTVFRDCKK